MQWTQRVNEENFLQISVAQQKKSQLALKGEKKGNCHFLRVQWVGKEIIN